MRTVAIVQARMGSTRLPGKVMMDLAGEPMLARVINRVRRATMLHEVVVATSTQPGDNVIVELSVKRGWPCFRGSEDDVLDRYYQAAIHHQADVVVRITADCPLIDPEVVDWVVGQFSEKSPLAYASNTTIPPVTFPTGQDVEVMSFEALQRAWREDEDPAWREHVTPYIHLHPEKFKLLGVVGQIDHSHLRLSVDTPEDMALMRLIYGHFGHDLFSWQDVLAVLAEHPEWLEINRNVQQKTLL